MSSTRPITSGSPARSPRSARPPTGLASQSLSAASLSRSRSHRMGRPPTSTADPASPRSARPPTRPTSRFSLAGNPGEGVMAITPNSKTVYVTTVHPWTVVPISTATNTAGNPIKIPADPTFDFATPELIAVTPDGRTVYVVSNHTHSVIPISTATNTAGPQIRFGSDCNAQPYVWPDLVSSQPRRQDRLLRLRERGDSDQHGHQHAWQPDPPAPQGSRNDRDHTLTFNGRGCRNHPWGVLFPI